MWDIWNFIKDHPNWIAPFIAGGGTILAGVIGVWMKRPLEKQALEVTSFRATIDGFDALVRNQSNRIVYLETRDQIREEYENDLVERLRECEDRRKRKRGDYNDSHC